MLKIIIGLGNPGQKYKDTRHNIGFAVLEVLASQKNLSWSLNKKFNSEITKDGNNIFVKPQTFMNNSGEAVRKVLNYYKLLPKTLGIINKKNTDLSDQLVIIHDDIDIEFGKFKIQDDKSSGGHNGIKSIISHLKTQKFTRVRVGVANPLLRSKITADKFVLQNFSGEEKKQLEKIIPQIIKNL